MKTLWRCVSGKLRLPALWVSGLVVSLAGAGCAGQDAVYHEVRASRVQAFREWRRSREQQSDPGVLLKGELSLQDAIKLAFVHNKSLQAIVQQKEIARGRVVKSYSEALPKAAVVGTYTRLDKLGTFDVGGQSIAMGFLDNYSVNLQVTQPIFRGGAIGAALRAATVFANLSDEQVRGAVQKTTYAVARDYYEVLLAQHLFSVNEQAVNSAESHLEDVKRKRAGGAASEFDVLRAQVDVSNFRAEMIQQGNRIHLATARLLKTMGVSQASDVTLSDKLAYVPMRPFLEDAVRIAYENRPDLYQAELAIRLQEEALRIAKSRYWPQVNALFTQLWSNPDPHASSLDDWGDAWRAGISVSWPLFDGLAREGHLIQERAALKQRNIELLDSQERVLLELQQAILSLRDADEFVSSQRLNLDRAQEGLRLARVGYREGINTEVEVTDARAALTRARALHFQAIYNHTVARLELQRSMGILGPRAGVRNVPGKVSVQPAHIEEFDEAVVEETQKEPSAPADTP